MIADQDLEAAMASFARHRAELEKALGECETIQARNGLGLDQYGRIKKMHEALLVEQASLQNMIKQALENL